VSDQRPAPTAHAAPGTPGAAATGPLSYAVFSLARAHRGYAARLLRELGLHPGQELLLMQLLDRDHQLQSELLDSVGLDHSTVSKSLRRMQDAGLLVRQPTPEDRRALVVSLTDKGRAMREPLRGMWAELERVSVRDLDATAVRTFIDLAHTIQAAVVRRDRADPPSMPSNP
jgi:MarR family transcriptional regulator, organic hydroperoxide resistance regulator